jgi:NAD(P)-dependent dehydrogenase (short-subunit alcohol dehydrogenase family)
MTRRFEGKSVLVAGRTGALGRAVSLAFLDELAKVTVTYRGLEEFLALKNAAGAHTSSLEGHQVNVTDEAAVRQLVESVISKHGHLDLLVNAVGAYAGGMPLWELDSKVFDQMLALICTPGMCCRNSGHW